MLPGRDTQERRSLLGRLYSTLEGVGVIGFFQATLFLPLMWRFVTTATETFCKSEENPPENNLPFEILLGSRGSTECSSRESTKRIEHYMNTAIQKADTLGIRSMRETNKKSAVERECRETDKTKTYSFIAMIRLACQRSDPSLSSECSDLLWLLQQLLQQ